MKYNLEWLLTSLENGEKLKYLFFWGHTPPKDGSINNTCFSQWYASPFTVDKIVYKTAEHWMMAQKAILFNDQETLAKIIESRTPAEAKKLGRLIANFNEETWLEKRSEIVVEGNLHKFSQNEALKYFLLNTGPRVLVEASPVDRIWGIGMAADDPEINTPSQWKGLNLLGFALMEVREKLKSGN